MLFPYRGEIEHYARNEQPLIDQAILLWNCTHSVIRHYQLEHPNWIFVKHESICRHPEEKFQFLSGALDLPWTREMESFVQTSSSSGNPVDTPGSSVFDIYRSSKSIINVWKDRLDQDQIARIDKETQPLRFDFYGKID